MEQNNRGLDQQAIKMLCEEYRKNNQIPLEMYEKFDIKRGLRNQDGTGVMAGVTKVCNVHGYLMNEGEKEPADGILSYRGYDVRDLVEHCANENRFGFEEASYLLLFGSLPSEHQLADFCNLLDCYRELPANFFEDMILKAPSMDVMNKMARAVLALYSYDECAEDMSLEVEIQKAIALIARIPSVMVKAYQVKNSYYQGGSLVLHPLKERMSTAETILSLLRTDRAFTDKEAKLLDTCLILHAEHGGGNNSTFTCRVLTSSGTDSYSAYAGAIGSLKGPKHGGANIKVEEMMDCIKSEVKDWTNEDEVAAMLTKLLNKEAGDRSGLIYGMGHAIYTKSDPRAIILKKHALELAEGTEFEAEFRLIETIERLSPGLFSSVKGSNKAICANVDMYSGFVYRMLGIPSDLFTPLFACSRIPGWAAHRMEEMMTGKRIIRPAYKAVQTGLCYKTLAERS